MSGQIPENKPVESRWHFPDREEIKHAKKAVGRTVRDVAGAIKKQAKFVIGQTFKAYSHTKQNVKYVVHTLPSRRESLEFKVRIIGSDGYEKLTKLAQSITDTIPDPAKDLAKRAVDKVGEILNRLNTAFRKAEVGETQEPGISKDEFKSSDGKVLARETAVRIGTVDLLSKGMKVVNPEIDVDKLADGATWGSSNTPRLESEIEQLPILCNLRSQSVTSSSGQTLSSLNRSAAISDFSHGQVSLQELKDYPDLLKLAQGAILDKQRKKELGRIYPLGDDAQGDARQIVGEITLKAIAAYGDAIADGQAIDPEKLNGVIGKREERLKWMALQDLYSHFQQTKVSRDETLYTRVSLLDMNKAPRTTDGIVLDEHTQALDMKALFDGMEGATVTFDLDADAGPFFDEEGIHMPRTFAEEGVEATTLHTAFFNLSVSGTTDNFGVQRTINEDAMRKLREYGSNPEQNKHLRKISERLEFEMQVDPFETALQAVLAIQKAGGYVGINCYGGKDRTGYLAALVTHHYLKGVFPNGTPDRGKTLRKWGRQLVSSDGVAASIAMENADHTVLKLMQFDLKLYDTSTAHGKMLRTAAYIQALQVNLRARMGRGYILSDVVGQLYHKTKRKE